MRKSNFYHDLTPFTCLETVDSEPKRAEHTVTCVTTTTTQVEERKGPGGQSPNVYSASEAVESRRSTVLSEPVCNSLLDQLLQMQRLHREEKEMMLDFVQADYEDYKRFYEEQLDAFRTENERLTRELSASTSQNIALRIQLSSLFDSYPGPGTVSQRDKVDSAITTTITTITTMITTVTTQIEQWKHTVARNKGQITISNKELDQLLLDLATASSQMTELQQNYAGLSRDFSSVCRELQVTLSLRDEKDRTIATLTAEVAQWKNTDAAKAQQIAAVRQDSERFQRDLGSARKELQTKESLIEERDRTIASFTAEVAQWKRSDVAKGEQIATARRNSEKLQTDLSAFSSQMVELQKRYDAQSKELGAVRNELQANKSLVEEKDRTITTLTTKVAQAKREDSAKAEQIATARRDLEQLRLELSSASTRFAEIQERYAAQSQELNSVRDDFRQIEILHSGTSQGSGKPSKSAVAQQIARALEEKNNQMKELRVDLAVATSRNSELQRSYEALLNEVSVVRDQLSVQGSQHEGTIISLTAQVEQWKRTDAMKAEQMASTLEVVQKLQQDISTSISQLAELRGRYEAQSNELIAVRNELQAMTSSSEDKDRTVVALAAQVEEWKRSDVLKEERIVTARKQAEGLQRDLASTSSRTAELLQRYEVQSRELSSLQDELQDKVSSKDRYVSSPLSQVENWKRSDATKGDELITVRKDLAQLRRDLANSSSQIEVWKRSDATKTEELTVAQKDIEQLRRDLSTSSSQIMEYQQRGAAQLAELTSQIKQWKHSVAAKTEELATAGKKIEQLQHDLSASSSRITQAYEEQFRVLKSTLAERQSQLDSVQRFVTTADKYADTMIIQMLQKLNAEVQQYTEFMADRVLRDFGPRATKLTKEQSSAVQRVSESIGKTLTGCLGSEKRNDVALYLPIAFQAYLTYYLHSVISSWTIKKDRDGFINEIYERLRKSGNKLNFK